MNSSPRREAQVGRFEALTICELAKKMIAYSHLTFLHIQYSGIETGVESQDDNMTTVCFHRYLVVVVGLCGEGVRWS